MLKCIHLGGGTPIYTLAQAIAVIRKERIVPVEFTHYSEVTCESYLIFDTSKTLGDMMILHLDDHKFHRYIGFGEYLLPAEVDMAEEINCSRFNWWHSERKIMQALRRHVKLVKKEIPTVELEWIEAVLWELDDCPVSFLGFKPHDYFYFSEATKAKLIHNVHRIMKGTEIEFYI